LGEAVDNTALTWTTGGDENWFGQTLVSFYGGDAAQSGDVDDNQESWIQTTVTGPGVLSFYWKVSSSRERTHLVFVVDSTAKASCRADRNWELASVAIPSGSHALRWIYEPFSSGDAGFLDKVEFISGPAIVVNYPVGSCNIVT
jgi:hypothetical protein